MASIYTDILDAYFLVNLKKGFVIRKNPLIWHLKIEKRKIFLYPLKILVKKANILFPAIRVMGNCPDAQFFAKFSCLLKYIKIGACILANKAKMLPFLVSRNIQND